MTDGDRQYALGVFVSMLERRPVTGVEYTQYMLKIGILEGTRNYGASATVFAKGIKLQDPPVFSLGSGLHRLNRGAAPKATRWRTYG